MPPYALSIMKRLTSLIMFGALVILIAVPVRAMLIVRDTEVEDATISRQMLVAQADARVVQANPAANFGSSPVLRINGGSTSTVASYIRFVVYDVPTTIEQAVVRVYATSGSKEGVDLFTTSNAWDEMQVNWNTRPMSTTLVASGTGQIIPDSWIEYPVTSIVTGSGSYSFVLASASTDGVHFSSRDGKNPPQLMLILAPQAESGSAMVEHNP